ncbi:MAG: hypothetical protein PHP86_03940 [Nevskiales bacterium]|nr:hypothetical protein [Nevskiales bacterium]
MLEKIKAAAAVTSLVVLAGCGGGGGSDSSTNTPTPSGNDGTVTVASVSGPLDPLQDQVSTGVFDPLSTSVKDTPLESVVQCADQVVNQDVLDIADSVLVSLQAAATGGSLQPDPQAVAESLRAMVANMAQLLQALAADGTTCLSTTLSADQLADLASVLDGTPLAPLGDQLAPVLQQIIATIGGSGPVDGDLQLSTLATLVAQLNNALQFALAQIPAEAYDAPIVGGTLTTLSTALNDTTNLLYAVLTYDAATTNTALQTLLNNTVGNLLTNVVPLTTLEEQAGQPGALSGPILTATTQLAAAIGGAVGTILDPTFNQVLDGALAPVLDPIENEILPTIIGPIIDAIGGLGQGGDPTGPLSGTPLAPITNLLTSVLGTIGLGGGNTGSCPFANLPLLSNLCGLI